MKDRRVKTGALAVGAVLGVATSADAANFNVTSTGDAGPNTLRQAILDANANAGADTITFDASLSGSTITLSTGEMAISDSVDIQGLGAANLTVDANETSRVFYIYNPSPTPIDVTISGLTLTNGLSAVAGDPGASSGGAIRDVGESLTLDDVTVSNSTAAGDGGGIGFVAIETVGYGYSLVPATLTIQNSTITGNASDYANLAIPIDAGGCGGGVFAGGVLDVDIINTTITDNQSRCDGGGVFAVYWQPDGELTIQNSVITGNTAGLSESGLGGGVGLYAGYGNYSTPAARIVDSTISGNAAPDGGGVGAVFFYGLSLERTTLSGNLAQYGGGLLTAYTLSVVENSTIAGNTASEYGGGIYDYYSYLTVKETTISGNFVQNGDGAGVYLYYNTGATIVNSIIANHATADVVEDGSSFSDVSYSLIEDAGVAAINDNGGNIFGTDPQLTPLADNGGPTFTMKPAASSPAINAGDPTFTPPPSTDQRGFTRVAGSAIDMGSVEFNAGTIQFSVVSQNVNENAGTANVNVTRSGGTDGAVSVQVVVDGSSTATGGGADYTFSGAAINFADNDATPQPVVVGIDDDAIVEPPKTVVLAFSAPVGATVGAPATHTITIIDDDVAPAQADLSVLKAVAPGSVTQGDNVTFNLTVNNAGPDAASNVVVTDTLPAQLTFVSASPSAGSCSNVLATVTCNLGTLNSGASATIQIVATMTGSGATTNIASVASDTADNDGTDNSGSATFTILPAAAEVAIPTLDGRMQMLLAAIVAALSLVLLGKRS